MALDTLVGSYFATIRKKCGTEMVNVIGQNPVTCHEV